LTAITLGAVDNDWLKDGISMHALTCRLLLLVSTARVRAPARVRAATGCACYQYERN
jgi:hypothetical protein